MQLQPVDQFVREGFSAQMKKQFRCPVIYTTAPDKLRVLQAQLGNQPIEYPWMFLNVQTMSPNLESYQSIPMLRQGLPVRINTDNNQAQMVRLLPTNFEIEVTFVTNKYSGQDLDSVEGYIRRWLFARRNGSLGFNIDYGMTQLSISYLLGDQVPIAPRETPTEAEPVYQVITTATVHGYVSEPSLGTRGIVNQIALTDVHPTFAGATFFPF